jgi:predicted TIM-barrel fold metal-dependent hydrolase
MFTDTKLADAVQDFQNTVEGLPQASLRGPEPQLALPAGTIVVSADNHWTCAEDIFYEGFPEHLKARAPRWMKDGDWGYWGFDGKPLLPLGRTQSLRDLESVPGCSKIEPRMKDLDAEGIHKEIVFPNTVQAFYTYPDLEIREWIFRVYNDYLADMQAKAPGRFYGVGLCMYWDMDLARESIKQCKDLGLKCIFLPQYPKGANGVDLDYCSEEMEPLWVALEESGLPVMFHVGEFAKGGRGGLAIGAMVGFGPFRKTLGELIFGGIFDRHPTLQVVFTEADLNWIPGALQTAIMVYETYTPFLDPLPKHHPNHYWRNNCYAVFIYDPLGMQMLDIIGRDRVMWSSDYVHQESSFGYGWRAKKIVLDTCSEDDARAILGGTAMKLFKL